MAYPIRGKNKMNRSYSKMKTMHDEILTLDGAICTEKNLYNLRPLSPLFREEKKENRFFRLFKKGAK